MNLFSRLEKYKSTSKVSPEENFFTEGFAHIIISHISLSKEIFQLAAIKITERTIIRTQQMIPPNSFIDLYVENEKSKALIEVKLAADLNQYEDDLGNTYDQLMKYAHHLEGDDKVILMAYKAEIEIIKKSKYAFNLAFISWEQIHQIFSNHIDQTLLIRQFTLFMEAKSMNFFSGLNQNFFKSIGASDSLQLKTESAVRKQFKELCQEILQSLTQQDESWRLFIYSYDTTKKRYYCHFQNPTSNSLGLNINVEATPSGLGVLVWIPYWKFRKSAKLKEQGKINSIEICKLLDHYNTDQNTLNNELYKILNSIDSSYHISLHIKQYEHLKSSAKKAQGMQKGHDVELLKLNKGNTLIPNNRDNTLMMDRSKEVYDNTKVKTSIETITRSQIEILVKMLYEQNESYSDLKKFLIIKKNYPAKYVGESFKQMTKTIRDNVLDFHKIILKLNSLNY